MSHYDTYTGKQADPGSVSFFNEPNGSRCDECGTPLIDRCTRCGAPICCPRCCAEAHSIAIANGGKDEEH